MNVRRPRLPGRASKLRKGPAVQFGAAEQGHARVAAEAGQPGSHREPPGGVPLGAG
ncbi:hypothetical protein AB0M46_42930 [Dactylosporangium sp. NPDC051485]|uniref:hypothetical protein n=1 Tax=Dactylosporangium sp. NPDC051485 TaxID=3154846 RepID=UPI0034255896